MSLGPWVSLWGAIKFPLGTPPKLPVHGDHLRQLNEPRMSNWRATDGLLFCWYDESPEFTWNLSPWVWWGGIWALEYHHTRDLSTSPIALNKEGKYFWWWGSESMCDASLDWSEGFIFYSRNSHCLIRWASWRSQCTHWRKHKRKLEGSSWRLSGIASPEHNRTSSFVVPWPH